MNTFNLIISSNRNFEPFAEREIWFVLMILGDSSPVIMQSPITGILLINTTLDPYYVIKKMRKIMRKDPHFFQYVLRVIPIDQVIETDLELIYQASKQLYHSKRRIAKKWKKFAIQIKKRATPMSRNEIIDKIGPLIPNKVDLKNPDWVLHYEIIGNVTGISLMNPSKVLRVVHEKKIILNTNST
jgi:tRNA acetyltransferase TAN1